MILPPPSDPAAHGRAAPATSRHPFPSHVGDIDLACPGCGYNLRGLASQGLCPECAAPVWTAFVKRTLAMANPHWIAELSSGEKWLKISAFFLLLLLPVWWVPLMQRTTYLYYAIAVTLALAGLTIALWKLAAPNPADAALPRAGTLAPSRIARIALAITAMSSIVVATLFVSYGFGPTGMLVALAGSPFGIAGGVFFIALAHAFERVAKLAGDTFGEERTRSYRRGFLICWPIFLIAAVAVRAAPGFAFPLLFSAAGVLGFAALIVLSPTYFAAHVEAARRYAKTAAADPCRPGGDVHLALPERAEADEQKR